MSRPRVVLLRGHSANPWDLRPWETLTGRFDVRILATASNEFDVLSGLDLPVERVGAVRDRLPRGRVGELSVLVFGGPRGINALADAEQVAGPTMSKLVAGLEGDGLVRRRADPHDGRAVVLTATPKGRRLMERGRRQRVARLATELAALDAADRATLADAAAILRRLE